MKMRHKIRAAVSCGTGYLIALPRYVREVLADQMADERARWEYARMMHPSSAAEDQLAWAW